MTCEINGHKHPAQFVCVYGTSTVCLARECVEAVRARLSEPAALRTKSLYLANQEFLYNAFNKEGTPEIKYT